jgi:APA family basic amino acid/polyamine antiporter
MVVVSLCYGELASRSATAGGEFLYTLETFGPFPAFLVGWFLTFYMIAVCAFEGIALAWFIRVLIPQVAMRTMYPVAGSAVTADALIISFTMALIVAFLHLRGAGSAIRFQNFVTYSFICVSAFLIICGFSLGSIANLQPLLPLRAGHSPVAGVLGIFATSAYFLNGWQAALHAIEERRSDVSPRAAILSMVGAIGVSALFYACIILASSMAMPWQSLLARELPAAAAFRTLGAGGVLGSVVLIAAIVSLTKTWSATAWIATRLLYAQARHGYLPKSLAAVDPQFRAPRNAILVVTLISMLGMALGRSAIVPIVDTLAICAALSIILCLLVLLRRRRDSARAAFVVPGGPPTIWSAVIGASSMVGIGLIKPLLSAPSAIPIEWILLLAWGGVGTAAWRISRKARLKRPPNECNAALSHTEEL